jgi:hypothetical protein
VSDDAKRIIPPEPRGTSAGNAGRNERGLTSESEAHPPSTNRRKLLKTVSGFVGLLLFWPGSWSLYTIYNDYVLHATEQSKLESVFLALVIWGASVSLLRYWVKD